MSTMNKWLWSGFFTKLDKFNNEKVDLLVNTNKKRIQSEETDKSWLLNISKKQTTDNQ